MKLRELMDSRVMTVSANDYALSAYGLMRTRHLSRALVLDRDQVVGVLLMHDLEKRTEEALKEHDVRETMHTNMLVVAPDVEPEEAERLLRLGNLECLVVQEGQRIQGAISKEDLARPGQAAASARPRRSGTP